MATAVIEAGICGFKTTVKTAMTGETCSVAIESDCPDIAAMAESLTSVDPLQEISYRGGPPEVLAAARKYCKHAACPVPCGIIKAVEVAAFLALPRDASIKVTND